MKRNYMLLSLIAFLFIWTSPAFALPTLQLDISDGTYDLATETIFATTGTFTLYALLNGGDVTDTYYISAALVPKSDGTPADLGSFTFGGTTINATADMTFGTPPLDAALDGLGDLQTHGVYPTYFAEKAFTFNPADQVGQYNSQTEPGGFDAHVGGTGLYYAAFEIDTANLAAGYAIHFDLYNSAVKRNDKEFLDFAPFSHDAQSGSNSVPEPSNMLLLGTVLVGIAGISRKLIR